MSGRGGRGGGETLSWKGRRAIWVATNVTPLGGVLSAISRSSVVECGEGEGGATESGAVSPEVSLNSGGSDDRGSVVRACTREDLSARGSEDYGAAGVRICTYGAV